VGCFVVAEFLLTSASRGPSAIAEPLVISKLNLQDVPTRTGETVTDICRIDVSFTGNVSFRGSLPHFFKAKK